MAKTCFPESRVIQENLYLKNLTEKIILYDQIKSKKEGEKVLYVLEPIRKKWGDEDIPGEFQAQVLF